MRPVEAVQEIFDGDRAKFESGCPFPHQLIFIDYRILEAADARDNRNSPVPQGAKLSQSARLIPRRYNQGVGTALDKMGQSLVISDDDADPPRMGIRNCKVTVLEISVSGSKQS